MRAGLKAIYLLGWQVAADANLSGQTYPDQSLYPANSVPAVVRRLNQALLRADQIEHAEGAKPATDWLVADRGRCRGGLRRTAQRVRADEGDDRSGRGGRALRGPAVLREEVRPPGRQGAAADRPVHPHPGGGAARGRRAGRADRAGGADRCGQRQAHHQRHRRAGPAVPDRRADPGGLLPDHRRTRHGDRAGAGVRAVRGPDLVRDLDAGPRGSAAVRRGDARRSSPGSCWPTTARRRSTGDAARRRDDRARSSGSWARWDTSSSSSPWPDSTR